MPKHSSKKMDLKALLKNRNVLYVVFFFAIVNLFSYLMLKQLDAVAFFIIIGFLTTYFSKNMIIVMLTSMISTFFLVQINLLGKGKEGMVSGSRASETDARETDTTGTDASETDASKTDTSKTDASNKEEEDDSSSASDKKKVDAITGRPTASAGNPKGEKEKEKFTQKFSPARYNAADDDDTPRHKPKVDYAGTLETAYDNLDKLLSSDAIKNMSADTGRLAEKQQKLMGNIEKLTPIMDKASSLLQNLDIGGITGLMGGIQDRLKGFNKDGSGAGAEAEGK